MYLKSDLFLFFVNEFRVSLETRFFQFGYDTNVTCVRVYTNMRGESCNAKEMNMNVVSCQGVFVVNMREDFKENSVKFIFSGIKLER